jgi:hypothetical protein
MTPYARDDLCLLIVGPDGEPWNEDYVTHFATDAAANHICESITDHAREHGVPVPDLRLIRREYPCWSVACGTCGTWLGDEDDDGYGPLHFDTEDALIKHAAAEGWSTTGPDWACDFCAPLGADPIAGPVLPGPGQLTLHLHMTANGED